MRQRTKIILQVRFNEKNLNRTINETRVFYCQWGIGRILPKNVMSILHNVQSADGCVKVEIMHGAQGHTVIDATYPACELEPEGILRCETSSGTRWVDVESIHCICV